MVPAVPVDSSDGDLAFLTAQEAARLLRIDVKTLRSSTAPYIKLGKNRRYTKPLLKQWQAEEALKCQVQRAAADAAPRSRGSSISRAVPAHRNGKLISASEVVDFAKVAGLKPRKLPQHLP